MHNDQDQERAVSVCLNPFDGLDLQPCTCLILVGALLILVDGPRFLGTIVWHNPPPLAVGVNAFVSTYFQ